MKNIERHQLQLGAHVLVGLRGRIVEIRESEETHLPVVTIAHDRDQTIEIEIDPTVDVTYIRAADGEVCDGDVWQTVDFEHQKSNWVAFRGEDHRLHMTNGHETIDTDGFLMVYGPARRILKGDVDA